MKVHRIVFLTVLTFFLTACDVDLYRSLPEDEANQMLALLMQHHIDAEKKQEEDGGNDSNLLIVFYVQIMPDDFVMQLHRF